MIERVLDSWEDRAVFVARVGVWGGGIDADVNVLPGSESGDEQEKRQARSHGGKVSMQALVGQGFLDVAIFSVSATALRKASTAGTEGPLRASLAEKWKIDGESSGSSKPPL